MTGFEASSTGDRVDLRFANGINGFADLLASHMTSADGNTIITDGSNSMTLMGVSTDQLIEDNFLF